MALPPPRSDAPLCRGIFVHTVREVAVKLWGPSSLESIARHLPDDVRKGTIDASHDSLEWQPESYVVAWNEAAWRGPCAEDDARFRTFVDCWTDQCFGRMRRALVGFLTPPSIVRRAPDLWRHDHTHGTLVATTRDEAVRSMTVTLSDHPYLATPVSRRAIAETFRRIVSMTRVRDVRETHTLRSPRQLAVRISWGAPSEAPAPRRPPR